MSNFDVLPHVGMALDPIHVGTGGNRLGRVDNTIVRDPVTRIPKIPGSSLAGVTRAYAAMALDKYPDCAGQGGHCGGHDCPICTVFGFAAKSGGGGFAGLAALSDMHVLLFPVATYLGAMWVTAPSALRQIKELRDHNFDFVKDSEIYGEIKDAKGTQTNKPVNLGWLMFSPQQLPNGQNGQSIKDELKELGVIDYILQKFVIISDKLFTHVINSNLEVRTSVSIDPATGAAEEGALFTYEALPRGTILYWEVTAKNPQHFKMGGKNVEAVQDVSSVHNVVKRADPYLEALGIGGNNTRGMGRIRVLTSSNQK
jgi:CRISPR-associated protein Cmr4